ncbi:hypothetical protein ACFGXH_12160 [Pasteurella multocida]
MPKKMNLDDLTREIAAIITNFETVQDFVLDGDIETAERLYKLSLGHARKFGYRFKTVNIEKKWVQFLTQIVEVDYDRNRKEIFLSGCIK